jgi:hypothetical protein
VRVSSSLLINNAREKHNKDREGERWQRWASVPTTIFLFGEI